MTKKERTKKFIIEKSAEIINKKGMAGTAISDIMEATKLAKGGIYGNFENKDEICQEAFFYLANKLSADLDNAVSKGNNAKTKFFNLLKAYENNKSTPGGCPILNFGIESDDTDPNVKILVKKAIHSSQKRIFNIISDGIADNEITKNIDPHNFSIKVFAMIEGAIFLKKILGNNDQLTVVMDAIKSEFETYLE